MNDEPGNDRTTLRSARRVVIKLGTRVLTGAGDKLPERLAALADSVCDANAQGREVLIVSSGAVGLGCSVLGMERVPDELQQRQACAAIGQTRLMALYEAAFARRSRHCAQVLLTQGDFEHRLRYLNLRSTLTALLQHDIVPVINENDVVATEELAYSETDTRLVFGDNDKLSALVASKLEADLLVLLTDVDGVYDRDPVHDPAARLLDQVVDLDAVDAGSGPRAFGRGGMRSKVAAATVAARAGCHAVIASGIAPGVVGQVLDGAKHGTWFRPQRRLSARRRWIAFAASPRGRLQLDAGCVAAVRDGGASVLAAGVTRCDGEFRKGDIVELADEADVVFGRGMVFCDADVAREWSAGRRPAGLRNHHALVHRDHLVLDET